jgi:kumamolisin
MAAGRTEIPGSVVTRPGTVRPARPADPNQMVEVSVVLRRPEGAPTLGKTRDEIARSLSAPPDEISAVTQFARRYGLEVVEASPAQRTVRLKGPVRNINRAFGTNLAYFTSPGGTFLSYDGPLRVDSEIAPRIIAVLGLDRKPAAKPRASLR